MSDVGAAPAVAALPRGLDPARVARARFLRALVGDAGRPDRRDAGRDRGAGGARRLPCWRRTARSPRSPSRSCRPGRQHLLGTDEFGRDELSRLIWGARVSLYVGGLAVLIALGLGATAGVVAGFFGGWVDDVTMRIMDVVLSLPALVLAIAITSVLGPTLTNAMLAIGLVYAPTFARVARGPTLTVVQVPYIEAARSIGASNWRIIARHVLPNVAAPILVQMTVSFSTAILTEAALSFLGLGTQPPTASWGLMLSAARQYMLIDPWIAVLPGSAIAVTVLGFNLLGDGLRDLLDPRMRTL